MRALAIAATGMNAQQTNMEVIANNIANINTTGYKRARAEFTDLLYQAERITGAPARGGEGTVPEGAYIGLGVRTAAIRNLHQQGTLTQTNNTLDIGINGHGYFQITGPNGETYYSRAGAFNKNQDGQLRNARRQRGAANDHLPAGRARHHHQRDGRGLCDHRSAGAAAASRPAFAVELHQ